jgi:hypothetical protein
MLVLNGFFKDNAVVPDSPVAVPDGTRAFISFGNGPAKRPGERAEFKRGPDPQKQLEALKKFHRDLDCIKDEPLDEVFDRAVDAGLKFTPVNL